MIRKIEGSEYLKRYDNMTAQEREDYESRVGQWLKEKAPLLAGKCDSFEAQMQNILQMGLGWNDRECQAFDEGAKLLTALVNTGETWLPDMLYVKSVKRVVKRMTMVLATAVKPVAEAPKKSGATPPKVMTKVTQRPTPGRPTPQPLPVMEGSGQTSEAEVTTPLANREGQGESPLGVGLPPVRPKHIDQYVHLLPQKTQEHAAQVQGLYRELDEARQKMALLMDDQTATPADREAWAKKATKCDNALKKIFKELDAEWDKLVKSGRVVVDDLGNARVKTQQTQETHPQPLPEMEGSGQTSEAEVTTPLHNREGQGGGSAVGGSAKSLRKFLVDTRRGNGATRKEHVKKWKANFKEYAKLVGEEAYKDEKLLEAAKHYGIEVVRQSRKMRGEK